MPFHLSEPRGSPAFRVFEKGIRSFFEQQQTNVCASCLGRDHQGRAASRIPAVWGSTSSKVQQDKALLALRESQTKERRNRYFPVKQGPTCRNATSPVKFTVSESSPPRTNSVKRALKPIML